MDLKDIKKYFINDLEKTESADSLEKLRVKYLGRKSKLNLVLKSLKNRTLIERKKLGPQAQSLKREIEEIIKNKFLSAKKTISKLGVDVTAPGRRLVRGHLHPLTIVDQEVRKIFLSMGFSVVDGPEIEKEYYNFDALNIPEDHPARDAWDTFWIKNKEDKNKKLDKKVERTLLRTHTSPVQIRYMERNSPPLQIIVPGRVFRYEATDASHEINFYQLEGLMVGKNITLANFKFVVEEFFKRFFGGQSAGRRIQFRYRPSYFPFVEPGLEVDIKIAGGKWLEVMGAGMVNPHVFEYAHYNPRDWHGFAFGMGIDRLAMIKYKIPDIRMFYSGDLRLVKQF